MIRTSRTNAKILCVEDDRLVRQSLAEYLEEQGFDVVQAENGRIGLSAFHASLPDLVLCDLRMPELDGLEVLRSVKQASPDTPVIIVSGTDAVSDVVAALKLGAADFITKPIASPTFVVYTINRALEAARLKRENDAYHRDLEERVRRRTLDLQNEITERERAEALLKESLREKEVLLKEVHHRVKNNLQIISSLLNLQSAQIQDRHLLELIEESRNRIRSMALVHEFLYQSETFSRIDFGAYLRGLVHQVVTSAATKASIGYRLDVDDIELTIGTAVPCGLLMNELVTNAVQHAFSESERGTIFITARNSDGNLEVCVADDGKGLPASIDIARSESLGLRLVNSLVAQLHGAIEVERTNPGTAFRITFRELYPADA